MRYQIAKNCGDSQHDAVYDAAGHKVALLFGNKFKKYLQGVLMKAKVKSLVVEYFPTFDQYKIVSVKNSIEYKPFQILEAAALRAIIDNTDFEVTIKGGTL